LSQGLLIDRLGQRLMVGIDQRLHLFLDHWGDIIAISIGSLFGHFCSVSSLG